MINGTAIAKPQTFPAVLMYTDIRSYVFTFVLVALAVFTPWAFHQFHLAGPTFLPMHIFVLAAGLLFGWRAGLLVGLFAPLASYAVSGVPVLAILPQILVELAVYGLVAGILREELNLRVIWALLGAMVAGRLALLLSVLVIHVVVGRVFSPIGLEANPFLAVWVVMRQGWPGIAIQLASIPVLIWLATKTSSGRWL